MPKAAPVFEHSQEARVQMLASVEGLIKSTSIALQKRLRPRFTGEDREDFEQDVRVLLWKQMQAFDPGRGVKWATYAFAVIDRAAKNAWAAAQSDPMVQIDGEEWKLLGLSAPEDGPEEPRDTDTELHAAIGRQLSSGILSRLGPGHRRLVERVVFEGLTAEQIAEQAGHPVKVVKANIKAALRALSAKGLIGHVASAAEVAAVTAPVKKTYKQDWASAFRRKLARTADAPNYADRLGRLDDDVAAVLELIRCDGIAVEVAAELIDKTPRSIKTVLTRAFHTLAA